MKIFPLFLMLLIPVSGCGQTELTVVASNANVREEPSTQSKVIDRVQKDTKLLTSSSRGDWYFIVYGQTRGWIHRTMVQVSNKMSSGVKREEFGSTPSAVQEGTATVITQQVNLRGTPHSQGEVVARLHRAERLTVYAVRGSWYLVQSDKYAGWIHGNTLN